MHTTTRRGQGGVTLTELLAVLAIVGIGITVAVYGVVAVIVKADDIGVALAANQRPAGSLLGLRRLQPGEAGRLDRALRRLTQPLGRGLVLAMPHFLSLLGAVGTAAMLWVGGHILLNGVEELGWHTMYDSVHHLEEAVHEATGAFGGVLGWLVNTAASAVIGLVVGAVVVALMHLVPRRGGHDDQPAH